MNTKTSVQSSHAAMSSSEESKHDPESGRIVEKQSFYTRCLKEVDNKRAYIPMLVCCFVSGLTDGTIYNALRLGALAMLDRILYNRLVLLCAPRNAPRRQAPRSLGPLILFPIRLGHAGRRLDSRGVIDGSYPSHRAPGSVDFKEIAVIALLSFQAAGQIVSSRTLSVGEIPTVVVTSMLCDLMSDPALLAWAKNDKRNRRFVAFVLTLVGAICGGWISKASGAVQPSLWTVAGIKLVLAISWLFWTEK
ncbi:hypothetical protein CRV24_007248 [Beauveria bassiana]|nr:hypothetical protein CRV24_007248 [Beauveria bassiana]